MVYKNLRIFRESLGMTQKEFAASLSIGVTTYNGYETGARDPKSDFWIAVAQKYGVTIDYLMGYSDNPHRTSGTLATKKSSSTTEAAPEEENQGPDSLRSTLLNNFDQLNQEGRERLVETSDDMVASGKYIKSGSSGLGKAQGA